jgi:glycosyltransferase involved in cell wall biosynthesis
VPSSADASASDKRICIVTGEIAGPDFNGGIGTANKGLAQALRKARFSVDVLYTRVEADVPFCFRGTFADQVSSFAADGIRLMSIRHPGRWNDWPAKSFRALEHLEERDYHFVFFNDTHGTAYYPLLARRTGHPRLAATRMYVVAHSATQWIQEVNEAPISTIEDVRLMEMERRSLELSDVVLFPSRHLLRRYRGYGWSLPPDTRVMPNLLPHGEGAGADEPGQALPITELVFFGRLESRKGLWLFCSALDRMKRELVGSTVTFLGKPTFENGESTAFALLRRSAAWPFEIRLLLNYNRDQALGYLAAGKRLAVMPSLEENSPCAIQECLELGIPFIASSGSGGEELLAESTRPRCLFKPTVGAITEALRTGLRDGAARGTLSFDPRESERRLIDLLIASPRSAAKEMPLPVGTPVAARPEKALLVAVVPASVEAGLALAQARQIVRSFGSEADLVLLTSAPAELSTRIRGDAEVGSTKVLDAGDSGSMAKMAAARGNAVVGICHILQPITPALLVRAQACFQVAPHIAAVSAMSGRNDSDDVGPLPSHVSVTARRRSVQRFLLGNCPALFPLSPEMNCGFALFRGEVMASLRSASPLDPRYGRLRRVTDWIDDLLIELHAHGLRWELLPDCTLDGPAADTSFEVFSRGDFLRSLVSRQLRFAPGSHLALLARLAIETSLADERGAAIAECLSPIAERLGLKPEELATPDVSSDATLALLARMAHAAGQVELAETLAAQLVAAEHGEPMEIATLGRIVRRRESEICLFELMSSGRYSSVNLDHEWSYQLLSSERGFQQHPNPATEGRATLLFPGVDLRQVGRFRAQVSLANPNAMPVRFEVRLIPHDRSAQVGTQQVVGPMETMPIELVVPSKLRTTCNIVLTTEMALQLDTTQDAWARWIDPRFCTIGS